MTYTPSFSTTHIHCYPPSTCHIEPWAHFHFFLPPKVEVFQSTLDDEPHWSFLLSLSHHTRAEEGQILHSGDKVDPLCSWFPAGHSHHICLQGCCQHTAGRSWALGDWCLDGVWIKNRQNLKLLKKTTTKNKKTMGSKTQHWTITEGLLGYSSTNHMIMEAVLIMVSSCNIMPIGW